MSILSSDTTIDDALYALQADRVLLSSLARSLLKPMNASEETQFNVVAERVDREMEVLAVRLAREEGK